nr:N-acetylmuramoyl-L-alanine amidase [uncultured Prevotella sp.]
MNKKISFLLVLSFFCVLTKVGAKGIFTLVIDAGHGGHDSGAIGAISQEKNINLNVALAFGKYVERNLPDVKVVYTRKNDVFVPLKGRADIANRAKADLFISVHTNSIPSNQSISGLQVYTLGMHRAKDNLDVAMRENGVISMEKNYQQTYQGFDPRSSESYIMFEFLQTANMEKSVKLASLIQRSVCSTANRVDKGVHQAGFLVLRETSMPSCLIELGFITSAEEEKFLNSAEGIDLMARGIYEAFVEYKNMYNDKLVVPYRPANNKTIAVDRVVPSIPKQITRASVKPKPTKQNRTSQKPKPVTSAKPIVNKAPIDVSDSIHPVFKVQIFAVNKKLQAGSGHFKGHDDITCFEEGGLFKYTIGSSNDYNEIFRLRNQVRSDFPQAFVIAFKNGKRIDTNTAIAEFTKNKNKK